MVGDRYTEHDIYVYDMDPGRRDSGCCCAGVAEESGRTRRQDSLDGRQELP